jgi:site-specific DNA recombinase
VSGSKSERVALYARISTDMQAEEGFSIAAQLAEMREFAEQKSWSVVAEFVDPGITGRTLERPGLQDLLAAAEERSFDIVIVHELSRLSRSVFDTFAFFELLGKYQIGFVSVKEPQFDLSTPTGRLLLIFIAGINQYYIDILRVHTKKSKRQRSREGLYNASVAPYGYQHAGDPRTPPAIVEEEAKGVYLAFERYAAGRYSYQDLTDLVNDAGFRTRQGRRFSKDTIADMIRNPFYAGKVVYKEGLRGDVGETYDGLHEPIVSEELWNACLRVRQRRHHASRTYQRRPRPYLLSRIAHCHICGRKLRAQSGGKSGYYREMSYARGYVDCPNAQIGVRAEIFHRQISAIVRQLQLPPDWQEELAQMVGEDEETISLQNRRSRLIARRRRLKEGYIHGDFDEDEDIYRRELEQIRIELEQIPTEDDLLQIQQAAQLLGTLADVWDDAEPADQCDLIRLMLRDVQVDVAQGRLLFLRPVLVFVPLYRAIPCVQERDLGVFAPVWPEEMTDLLPYPTMPPIKRLPKEVANLPFVPAWPWKPEPSARISRPLSEALKARRRMGRTGGAVVAVPHPGVPPLLLDSRKWPTPSLEELSLSQVLQRAERSIAFLSTPLALQDQQVPDDLVEAVFKRLEEEGYWYLVDVVPASMPAHWVFTFFPEAWSLVRSSFWTAHNCYNALQKIGFEVEQKEHAFYWPVTLKVAQEIARQRFGILSSLSDTSYQQGMKRLESAIKEQGGNALIPSEVAMVEIVARKKSEDKGKAAEGNRPD